MTGGYAGWHVTAAWHLDVTNEGFRAARVDHKNALSDVSDSFLQCT